MEKSKLSTEDAHNNQPAFPLCAEGCFRLRVTAFMLVSQARIKDYNRWLLLGFPPCLLPSSLLAFPPSFPAFLFFFFLFGHASSIWKFLGQVLNPCHSSDLNHCSDYTGSLTCYATRELLLPSFLSNLASPQLKEKKDHLQLIKMSLKMQRSYFAVCKTWKELLGSNVLGKVP